MSGREILRGAGRWDEPTRHPHRAQVATLTKTESVYETVELRLGTPADHSGQVGNLTADRIKLLLQPHQLFSIAANHAFDILKFDPAHVGSVTSVLATLRGWAWRGQWRSLP
jgi:hypothetical protein